LCRLSLFTLLVVFDAILADRAQTTTGDLS